VATQSGDAAGIELAKFRVCRTEASLFSQAVNHRIALPERTSTFAPVWKIASTFHLALPMFDRCRVPYAVVFPDAAGVVPADLV